jgi:hypothetical protein
MTKNSSSLTNKIALTLLILSAIFWLGSINIRSLIGNELLDYDEFAFKLSIPPDREFTLFQMLSNSSLVVVISYLFVLISAIWFLKTTNLKIKNNGWLLMSAILFFMFVPVELYTNYLDIKFMIAFNYPPYNRDELLKIFGERLGAFRGLPVIAVFCYYTIIPIVIFKPLRKETSGKDEETKKN